MNIGSESNVDEHDDIEYEDMRYLSCTNSIKVACGKIQHSFKSFGNLKSTLDDNTLNSDESDDDMNAMERTLSLGKLRDGILDNIIERIKDPKDRILVNLLYKVCNQMDPSRNQFLQFAHLMHQHGILANDIPRSHMSITHQNDSTKLSQDDAWTEWSEDDYEESVDEISNKLQELNVSQPEKSNPMQLMLRSSNNASDSSSMHEMMSRYQKDFEELECIGYGAFGVVHLCKHRLDSMYYAIKQIIYKHKSHNHDEKKEQIIRECTNIATLNHQNIVRYYTAWIEPLSYNQQPTDIKNKSNKNKEEIDTRAVALSPCSSRESSPQPSVTPIALRQDEIFNLWKNQTFHSCLYLQTEYCGNYSLKDFINEKHRKPNTNDNMHLFSQILLGLAHVHSKHIIHRDLKPENIFLVATRHDKLLNASHFIPKIGDFGLSKSLIDKENVHLNGFHPQHMNDLTKNMGTSVYASPEQLHSNSYDTSADIYSLGIILFELIQPPFETQMERMIAVSNFRNKHVIDEACIDRKKFAKEIDLMLRMTDRNPSKRPSAHGLIFEQFIQCYWMKNVLNAAIPSMPDIADKHPSNGLIAKN